MSEHRHLRLVEPADVAPARASQLLEGPPWSWFALMAATLVAPAVRTIGEVLATYEAGYESVDTERRPKAIAHRSV